MKRSLNEFVGLYQVSHTLKFELRPVGKTSENLAESGLLEQDFKRAEDYPEVKKFLDDQHKKFLQKVLSRISDINWEPLSQKIKEFQDNKDLKKELEKTQAVFRKKISDKFAADDFYPILVKEATPSKLFKHLAENSEETTDEVKTFSRFACYFKNFQENRKNIYSSEEQQTASAYRAVNENFTKFFNMVKIFSIIENKFPDLLNDIKTRTSGLLDGKNIGDIFKISSYNQFLPQSGIDFLNSVIGEINYSINQYRQQHNEVKSKDLPFMPILYKQILSDREQAFTIEAFENDADVCLALKKFSESTKNVIINGCKVELFSSLQKELANINEDSNLFIDAKAMEKISTKTAGRWDKIQDAMNSYASQIYKSRKEQEKYCKSPVFNLQEIKLWDICKVLEDDTKQHVDITAYWNGDYANQLFEIERNLSPVFANLIAREHKDLRSDKETVNTIKEYLDAVQNIFNLVKPLVVSAEYGGDLDLLGTLTAYYTQLESIIPLYNQTRNYVTKKVTDAAKIKLMFNNPILASGWPDAQSSSCVLFRDKAIYYLGILSDKHRTCLNNIPEQTSNESLLWEMMELNQMADPAKDLPNLLQIDGKTVRKTGRKNKTTGENKILEDLKNRYLPSNINRIRKSGSYSTVSENFSREDLNAYIDFYKERISEYKNDVTFHFKDSAEYQSWLAFTEDLNAQAYQVNFVFISRDFITQLVDDGKMYLFQIWNKDFSEKTKGTPNKFTLYWNELFSPENLANVVFKLNGEAELFLRKPAIKKPVVHVKGEKLVNRTVVVDFEDTEKQKAVRETIPSQIHDEIFRYINGRTAENDLSEETRIYLEKYPIFYWEKGMPISNAYHKVIVKNAPFEIVKDKRFTEDKYLFHVPITLNFKSPSKPVKFNDKVLKYLENNPDVKIIGLDRGERNLIYLTLIDQQGNILKQESLNLVNGVDYHEKLDLREKERDKARKSWQEIGQIKDLKSGYLSTAVYKIVKMMVEENAIVVMEDLNIGFKRGRMKIEKQIYQNFEKALIEKLNYLVFKDQKDRKAPGGILSGYQLSNKFESFTKLGKQCGFIFYVPAGYTSKIDPATGFVNIFNTKDCTSAETIKAFLECFDSIRYSAEHDAFAFEFDYRNFKLHQTDFKNKWTVFSVKEAWQQEKDKTSGKFTAVFRNPTEELKSAVSGLGLTLKDSFDLLAVIRSVKAENSTAAFFHSIFHAFKLSTALRHSSKNADKIISPVLNANRQFFISDPDNQTMPADADANGAFHIALKGLQLLKHGIKDGKLQKLTTEDWLKFVQTRNK